MAICFDEAGAYGGAIPCDHTECFYCDKVMSFPHISWLGGGPTEVILHPMCFVELSTRLFRDLHEIECKEGLLRTLVKHGRT